MIIYKVVNKINGKIYIGQTINTLSQRKASHYHEANYHKTNYVFHKALNKYKRKDFKWSIVCKCRNKKVIDFLEDMFIKKFNSFYGNGMGYNMTIGGQGFTGRSHSEKTKKILSEKNKRPQTENTKKKISKGLKIAYESGERIHAKGMLGKKHSKKTKKIMSKKAIGNTNGCKIWKAIYNENMITIKNLTKWCKENNYSYQKAKWRIIKNIDLSKGNLRGKWCRV